MKGSAGIAGIVGIAGMVGIAAPARAQTQPFVPHRLARVDRTEVEWLLQHRLPCLGCHRLDGKGGVVGPDLTHVADRRTAAFIYGMVRDPQATLPGSRMPKIPMPDAWRTLVASFLAEGKSPTARPSDPAPPDNPVRLAAVTDGAALYQQVCAACHGRLGKGDGYNAVNLPVRPTAHADSAYMSTRPDDVLFDGIYAGAYTLNKSNLMPAWGETLSGEQIRALVRYIRELCHCRQPEWAK
jgi:cytochrome c oxidase cbb3-type subunit III